MSDVHEWESTLAKFEDPIDKLGYLFGLTHYSLESGADCYVEIKKILPVVHARCESLRDRIETLECEKAVMCEALQLIDMRKEGFEEDLIKCPMIAYDALRETTPSLLLDVVRAAEECLGAFDNDFGESIVGEALQSLKNAIRAYRAAMNGEEK